VTEPKASEKSKNTIPVALPFNTFFMIILSKAKTACVELRFLGRQTDCHQNPDIQVY